MCPPHWPTRPGTLSRHPSHYDLVAGGAGPVWPLPCSPSRWQRRTGSRRWTFGARVDPLIYCEVPTGVGVELRARFPDPAAGVACGGGDWLRPNGCPGAFPTRLTGVLFARKRAGPAGRGAINTMGPADHRCPQDCHNWCRDRSVTPARQKKVARLSTGSTGRGLGHHLLGNPSASSNRCRGSRPRQGRRER